MLRTRRDFLQSAGSCVCCSGFAVAASGRPARAAPNESIFDGCFIADGEVRRLRQHYSKLGNLQSAESGFGNLVRSTGDRDVDVALDKAIKRLADTFGVYPGFAFFDDGDSPNAWATTESLVPDRKHTVIFGLGYYRKWLQYDPSGVSVLSVIAHEFGHIMQYESGRYQQIKGDLPTSKRIELHADYMAGYYIGILKRKNPNASFWKAGDKFRRIGTYDEKNPDFHGTPHERVAASQQGFSVGFYDGRGAQVAFELGMGYVATV